MQSYISLYFIKYISYWTSFKYHRSYVLNWINYTTYQSLFVWWSF